MFHRRSLGNISVDKSVSDYSLHAIWARFKKKCKSYYALTEKLQFCNLTEEQFADDKKSFSKT